MLAVLRGWRAGSAGAGGMVPMSDPHRDLADAAIPRENLPA